MRRKQWLKAIVVLGFLTFIACTVPTTQNPATATVNHPRLFFEKNRIPDIQRRASTTHREIWLPIYQYVEGQREELPPTNAPVNGDLDWYRNAGNRLIPLAFACTVSAEEADCALAKQYLLTYATWTQWGNNQERGLGLAHMLLGNALAYDWLYQHLTTAEQQVVRVSLGQWAERMYKASIGPKEESWNNWWYNSYIQNHFVINNSALGMAALALYDEDPRAHRWLEQAVSQMERSRLLLNGIADGSWHEGISYQTYMLSMAVPFWLNLRTLRAVDLFPHIYLRNYTTWRLYNYLPGTDEYLMGYGNFSWSDINSRSHNVIRFVANEYHNGYAEWLFQQILATSNRGTDIWSVPWFIFEFFYYAPTLAPLPPNDLPTVRTFSDLEGVIWRSGWGTNDIIFGLKSGAYGGRFAFDAFVAGTAPWDVGCTDGCRYNFGHDHDDTNGFYLFGGGEWMAPEMVSREDYSTKFHNTILIDQQGQSRPVDDSLEHSTSIQDTDGKLLATADTASFSYLAADATQRYNHIGDMQEVSRHVLFVRPNYFVMVDNLRARQPHRYEWTSHFVQHITLDGDWIRGHANADQLLGINVVEPHPFVSTTGEHGNLPFVQIRPETDEAKFRFVNLLYPTTQSEWHKRPTVTLVDDNGQAVLIQVKMNDGTQHDVIVTYSQTDALISLGDYAFDGDTALVQYDTNGEWTNIAVYGATFFRRGGIEEVEITGIDTAIPFEVDRTQCESLEQEAEAGIRFGAFTIGKDHEASNGQYIHVPENSGDNYAGSSTVHKAYYCFQIDTPGEYLMQGWGYGTDDLADSFYVQIDGQPETGYLWDSQQSASYQADYVSERNGDDPVTVKLAAGIHFLTIALREDGTRLDRIALLPAKQSVAIDQSMSDNKVFLPSIQREQ